MTNRRAGVVLALLFLTLGACGGAPNPQAELHAAAQQYLRLATVSNEQTSQVLAELKAATTDSQSQASYFKLAKIDRDFDAALVKIKFPHTMDADVQALLRADAAVIRATEAISISPRSGLGLLFDQLNSALAAQATAVLVVRKDLGLPGPTLAPASS